MLGTSVQPDIKELCMAPPRIDGTLRSKSDLVDFGWWVGHFLYDCGYEINGIKVG